jgi:putative hydroxymethylpyrimidine transport system substrate-binding protein
MAPRRLPALLLAATAMLAGGCGGTSAPSDSRPDQPATLLLDGAPGATDAGIYLALERGYDEAEGVHLQVRPPSGPTDAVRALTGGQAEMAVVDVHDLALARQRGRDVVAVMAIVQTPLAAVLARPGVRAAAELRGRRVGVSGRPADRAIVRAIAGGPFRAVRVGGDGARALTGGRVAAVAGFWTEEGVALKRRIPRLRELRIDALDPPPYPELVLAASRETLDTEGPVVRATIRALRRGYEAAIDDPESAVSALTDADPSLDRTLTAAQLDAVSPAFAAGATHFGELDPGRLARWARWEQRVGIVRRAPDVARAFDVATSLTGLRGDPNA